MIFGILIINSLFTSLFDKPVSLALHSLLGSSLFLQPDQHVIPPSLRPDLPLHQLRDFLLEIVSIATLNGSSYIFYISKEGLSGGHVELLGQLQILFQMLDLYIPDSQLVLHQVTRRSNVLLIQEV